MSIGGGDGYQPDDDPRRPLLPPEDRVWRHPSELGGSSAPPPSGRVAPGRGGFAARRLAAGGVLALATVVAYGLSRPASPAPVAPATDASTVSDVAVTTGSPSVLAVPAAAVGASVVAIYAANGKNVTVGSGFVWRPDGTVVTTRHLVGSARRIRVVDSRGGSHDARLVGSDDVTDVAVLKAAGAPMTPAPAAAASLRVGELVMAVAPRAPGRGQPVATMGTVQAVGTSGSGPGGMRLLGVAAADMATPPTWEGAPVVDTSGKIVGLLAATGPGAMFVPAGVAFDAGAQLASGGAVTHGWLGVDGVASGDDGILVHELDPGSPGRAAGVRVGDLIAGVNGSRVTTLDDLRAAVRLRHPGDLVVLDLTRGTTPVHVTVRLGEMPPG